MLKKNKIKKKKREKKKEGTLQYGDLINTLTIKLLKKKNTYHCFTH